MGAVKDWALSVCMAVVAGGIAYMISPGKNLEKIYRVVLSVFFITVILSPIVGFSLDGSSDYLSDISNELAQHESDKIEQQSSEHLEAIITETTRAEIIGILAKEEIFPKEVSLTINTDDITDILINDMTITIDKEDLDLREVIKNIVRENLSVTPEIISE